MGEMVSYIFGTLERTETAVRNISKNLGLQKKFNNQVALFAAVAAVDMACMYLIMLEHDKKIKKLNDEIEKLKEPTESCEESTESTS